MEVYEYERHHEYEEAVSARCRHGPPYSSLDTRGDQKSDTLEMPQKKFLEGCLHKEPSERGDQKTFQDRAVRFWYGPAGHVKDYLANPQRYRSLLTIYYRVQGLGNGHEYALIPM